MERSQICKGICDLAEKYDAMVMVDDAHAAGFIGKTGRGTPEYCGVQGPDRHHHRDVRQSARRRERRLHQRAEGDRRAPPATFAALSRLEHRRAADRGRRRSRRSNCLTSSTALRDKLEENTKYFRAALTNVA